jgi:hypothetical protein
MNWETLYNQHKDNLLIEEIEMKWREESMVNYPIARLGDGSNEPNDGVLLTESRLFIVTEDGKYIAY